MTRIRGTRWGSSLVAGAVALAAAAVVVAPVGASPVAAHGGTCSSGAHSLSPHGSRVYPEVGNGGYRSVHTDVDLVYDADANRFLPGNHVDLTEVATQCLTDFSLDFERSSADRKAGPRLTVQSVTVNGQPATFAFVKPTYPGDPNGDDDPDPLAHAVSNHNPVGPGNPNPPACSPQVAGDGQNGRQCPANKMVITPSSPIPDGATFVVSVAYTGKPGVHHDGDGTTEGWFRSNRPHGDGGFVTTEPVGTEDWMPLNDFPTAKPTYDFHDTVNLGRTAIANGELMTTNPPPPNPPDANFPGGSVTWVWHSPEPIANYLVENSVGSFDLTERVRNGITFYEAQASSIRPGRKAKNIAIMNRQPDITKFESTFAGPFPFTTDGVVIGLPSASFEEEMQGKITFEGGRIDVDTLYHENMHQWFGDNVSEDQFRDTFWKEGWATVAEILFGARFAQRKAGGPGTPAGDRAFDQTLVHVFGEVYAAGDGFWKVAPSNPTVGSLFGGANTYVRPAAAYVALRQILGARAAHPAHDLWIKAMHDIQRMYGGGSITEAQLEAVFHHRLPNQSAGCQDKLTRFFHQWFDTAYPGGGGANRPRITGPGLPGPDHFYKAGTACAPPPGLPAPEAPVATGAGFPHVTAR
jgi:hypothetical protein